MTTRKAIFGTMVAALILSGCAGKRYDSATLIESRTQTEIKHEGTAPVSQSIPMAAGEFRHNIGNPTTGVTGGGADPATRSLNGKKLVEVKFIKRDGGNSVLQVIETGERFKLKGDWGHAEEVFKIER